MPGIVEKRLEAVEATLDVLAEWAASRGRAADLLPDPRKVEEALGIGWRELLDLISDPQVAADTRDRFVVVCEEAINLWQHGNLPRRHELVVDALAQSVLDLLEASFGSEHCNPEAEDDDPQGTYAVPWWIG